MRARSGAAVWRIDVGEMLRKRLRHRSLEIQGLRAAKAGAFVFTGGQATAQDTARVIVATLPKILNISRSERNPCVGQFLERLRASGGQVLHDIPVDGFNLDHVGISLTGRLHRIQDVQASMMVTSFGKQSPCEGVLV